MKFFLAFHCPYSEPVKKDSFSESHDKVFRIHSKNGWLPLRAASNVHCSNVFEGMMSKYAIGEIKATCDDDHDHKDTEKKGEKERCIKSRREIERDQETV